MKTLPKRYVDVCKWTGRIRRVSSIPAEIELDDMLYLQMNDDIIQDMYNDKITLESGYVGYDYIKLEYVAYKKYNTIHFPIPESEYIELEENQKNPDINIVIYTNNKLMDITINYRAVKSWYNHRLKQNFNFANNDYLAFKITTKDNKTIKELRVRLVDFLETFNTTVDLSYIKNMEDIKIYTKRVVRVYNLELQKNKYFSLSEKNESTLSKTDIQANPSKTYNIIISKTNKEKTLLMKFKKLNVSRIYKSLNFYITGNDPNELHEVFSIPIEGLWNKKIITAEIKTDLDNKVIWYNNRELSVLFNKKVIEI